MADLGSTLRTAREAQGLSLSDVADRLHIRSAYLAAIESEDWAAIGPPVYARGFVRSYARFVGIDADAAVAALAHLPSPFAGPPLAPAPHRNDRTPPPGRGRPVPVRSAPVRGLSVGAVVGIVVAVGLVAFVGYEGATQLHAANPAPVAAAGTVGASQPSAGPAALEVAAVESSAAHRTDGERSLEVRLTQRSWLRVTVDGHQRLEGTFPAGTTRTFHGSSATVRAGNAAGVEIVVDGKDAGTLGSAGDVAERAFHF